MADYNSVFTGPEIDDAIDKVRFPVLAIVDKTASFDFSAAELNSLVEADSSSAIVCTIPPASTFDAAVGTVLMVRRVGTGAVSFAAGSGVTFQAGNGLTLTAQYRFGVAIKVDTDLWSITC